MAINKINIIIVLYISMSWIYLILSLFADINKFKKSVQYVEEKEVNENEVIEVAINKPSEQKTEVDFVS